MWVDARSTHARRLKRSTRPYKNISSFDQAFSMVYTEEEGPRPFDPREFFSPRRVSAHFHAGWNRALLENAASAFIRRRFSPFFSSFSFFRFTNQIIRHRVKYKLVFLSI